MNVTATLFGQMITFVIFVWFIKAYLWEPLTKAMDDRSNKIADGLAAAEKGQQKIEQAEIQFTTRIDEAKTKASGIITDAEQQSKNIVDEARTTAKDEAAKIAKSSSQQLEQEVNSAREKLKADVAEMAIMCAEKIIAKKLIKNLTTKLLMRLQNND